MPLTAFEDWWLRKMKRQAMTSPDACKQIASEAFAAGLSHGRNYTTDKEQHPTEMHFTNGRVVKIEMENGRPYLEVV